MTGCCIKGCKNRSENGYKLLSVPVDKKRREEWLKLMGRDILGNKAAVCETHFDEDQFEQFRQDGKKLLRPFGKPNLLRRNEGDEPTISQQQDNSKQTTDLNEYESNTTTSNENNSCSVNSDNTNREITTNTVLRDTALNHETYDEEYVTKLKRKLETTELACNILKKKFRQANSMLNTLINDDQKYYLRHGNHKGMSWSTHTMSKALRLYVTCGRKGYEEICRQFPYPSIQCIENRLQSLKFKPGRNIQQ